jgi:hypothetical protein
MLTPAALMRSTAVNPSEAMKLLTTPQINETAIGSRHLVTSPNNQVVYNDTEVSDTTCEAIFPLEFLQVCE